MKTSILFLSLLILSACAHNKIRLVRVAGPKHNTIVKAESKPPATQQLETKLPSELMIEHGTILLTDNSPSLKFIENVAPIEEIHIGTIEQVHTEAEVAVRTRNWEHSSIAKRLPLKRQNGDTYLYGIAALVALGSFGIVRGTRRTTLKISRLAQKNKYTSKGLIALAQIGIGYLGYASGHELQNIGYEVSLSTQYIAGGVGSSVFLGMYLNDFFGKGSNFGFFRKKLGMALITSCLFTASMTIGNGLESQGVVASPIASLVETTNSVTSSDKQDEKVSMDRTEDEPSGMRPKGFLALYIILAILLGLIVIAGSCLAICAWGAGGFLVLIPALILYILFNIGMSKRHRRKKVEWGVSEK